MNNDKDHVPELINTANSDSGLAQAQAMASTALQEIGGMPADDAKRLHNGCAATLSALLRLSGIDIAMTLGAGHLAEKLGGTGVGAGMGTDSSRGWIRVAVGQQQPGDVGVCYDLTSPSGADHIYVVVKRVDDDAMVIADNQAKTTHARSARGKDHTTRTEYFLRASSYNPSLNAIPSLLSSAHGLSMQHLMMLAQPALTTPTPNGNAALFSIDTNLKTKSSPLNAEKIESYFELRQRPGLRGIGEAVMAASEKYGINATYIVAHAILESGWGTAPIYLEKNNLFGWNAFDSSPFASAKGFPDRETCIDFVMGRVNDIYLNPKGTYFRGAPCLGNKQYGMNVNYALEPEWGTDIASIARKMEASV